jgi:hypothetical protein
MDCSTRLKTIQTLLASLLFLALSACVSNQPKETSTQINTEIPGWVKAPPGDNSVHMYGIGEGYSLDRAKQSALKDIAGKLATHVKSETENRSYLQNGQLDSSFKQKINTHVKDTKLTNYETLKTAQNQGLYYVLISMSRAAFVKDKQDQLVEINNKISTELNNIEKKNKLLQLVSYNEAINLGNQARPLIYLINAADSKADVQHHLDTYRKYEQKEKRLSETTQFFLKSNVAMDPLVRQIQKALQINGFQLSGQSKADSIVELKGSMTEQEIFSTKNVKINFDVLTKTRSGQLVSSRSYQLTGSSVSSYDFAREIAMNKLTKKLSNKADVYHMLGLVETLK